MTIDQAWPAFVEGADGVAELLSPRIFQNRLPDGVTFPALLIQRIESDPTHDVGYLPDHAETRYRLRAYAKTFAELVAIRSALKGIDGYNSAEALLLRWDPGSPLTGSSASRSSTATFLAPEAVGRRLPVTVQAVRMASDDTHWSPDVQAHVHRSDWLVAHTELYTRGY